MWLLVDLQWNPFKIATPLKVGSPYIEASTPIVKLLEYNIPRAGIFGPGIPETIVNSNSPSNVVQNNMDS